MKFFIKITIYILFALFISVNTPAKTLNKADNRILVLETNSSLINKTQSRILREKVMRLLLKENFSVIPVMQLEKYIIENKLDIRKCSNLQLQEISKNLNAGFGIKGLLKKYNNKLVYKLSIYNKKKDMIISVRIKIDEKSNFFKYCDKLAQQIVATTLHLYRNQ